MPALYRFLPSSDLQKHNCLERHILQNWSGLKLISFLPVGSVYIWIGSLRNWRDLQYVSPSTIEGLVGMWKWMMTGASYQTVRDTIKIMPYKGLSFYIWKRCMNLTYVKWEVPVWHRPKKSSTLFHLQAHIFVSDALSKRYSISI